MNTNRVMEAAFDDSVMELKACLEGEAAEKSISLEEAGAMHRAARAKGGRRMTAEEIKSALRDRLTKAQMGGLKELEATVIGGLIEKGRFEEILSSESIKKALHLAEDTPLADVVSLSPDINQDTRRVQSWKTIDGRQCEASNNEVLAKLTKAVAVKQFDPLRVVQIEHALNVGERLPEPFLRALFS